MKTVHIVMVINFVVLALFGTWIYSEASAEQALKQHQWECTTDTECEEEELLIKEGKQS